MITKYLVTSHQAHSGEGMELCAGDNSPLYVGGKIHVLDLPEKISHILIF